MRTFGEFRSGDEFFYGELRGDEVHRLAQPYWIQIRPTGEVLPLANLQIAIGNIEADCVTEDVIERLVHADVFRWSAQHHRELCLEIRSMLGERNFDRAIMRQKRARRLKPD